MSNKLKNFLGALAILAVGGLIGPFASIAAATVFDVAIYASRAVFG